MIDFIICFLAGIGLWFIFSKGVVPIVKMFLRGLGYMGLHMATVSKKKCLRHPIAATTYLFCAFIEGSCFGPFTSARIRTIEWKPYFHYKRLK